MANTRELKNRMKSIRDTLKITNAMYMISSTKQRKARKELEETEPYFFSLQSMLARIIRHVPDVEHRYLAETGFTGKKKAYLVVTADKGLAGAYNHNVLQLAEKELEENPGAILEVVGEVGRQYFHSKKIEVDDHFLYTAQNPTMHRARIIAARMLELYDSGAADEIVMIFTSMENSMQTKTNTVRLLPVEKELYKMPGGIPLGVYQEEFSFQPSVDVVIDHIIPNYLAGFIYGALVESYCSEHNARMTAMQAANDNGQAMLHSLGIEYNRVRQAAITQEITEVISGAKAQKKKKRE